MTIRSGPLTLQHSHSPTILTVDDDRATLSVLSEYLQNAGFRVIVARDGESAMEKARYGHPDLILLDLVLPKMDGFETCRRLKKDETLRDIPVIFMTVLTETADKVRGFQVGGADYVTKPFQHEELLARIRTHLALHSMQEQLEARNAQLQHEIDERKLAEQALRENEELSSLTLGSISDAVFLTDDNGTFILICPNVDIIFGYSFQEVQALGNILGLLGADLFVPSELDALKEISNIEREVTDKAGGIHTLLVTVKQVAIKGGTRLYTCRDITERKTAEEALQKSNAELERRVEDRTAELARANSGLEVEIADRKRAEQALRQQFVFLQKLIDTIPCPIFYKDAEGTYLGCNAAFGAFLGLSPADIVGKTLYDLAPKDLADRYREADLSLFRRPGIQRYESSVRYADGSYLEILFTKATFSDANGMVTGLVGVMLDVTERKQAEEAVKRSENRYRTLVETMNEGLVVVDSDGVITYNNGKIAEMLGYSKEELTGKSVLEFADEANRNILLATFSKRKTGEALQQSCEVVLACKGGSAVPVLLSTRALFDEDGTSNGSIVTLADLTQRKQAEEQLRESEELLQSLVRTAADAIISIDDQGNVVFWNSVAEKLFGYSRSEVVGKPLTMIMPERFRAAHSRAFERAVRTAPDGYYRTPVEVAGLSKDGKEFPIELTVGASRQRGRTLFTGIVRDITDRKATEESLKRRTAMLRILTEVQSEFIAGAHPQDLFDELVESLLELTDSECGFIGEVLHSGSETSYLRIRSLTTAVRNQADRHFRESQAREKLYPCDLNTPLGEVAMTGSALLSNNPVDDPRAAGLPDGLPPLTSLLVAPLRGRDETERLSGMIGIANRPGGYDEDLLWTIQPFLVTCANLLDGYRNELLRTQTEKALRESEERMRLLIEVSPIGIRVTRDGNYAYVNPAFVKLFGYEKASEIVGRPVDDLYVPEDRARIRQQMQDRLAGKRVPPYYEITGLRKTGEHFDVGLWVTLIEYEGRESILGFAVDLSSEKRLRAQLFSAQKMEAIGTLAGGIAHDFNNLLTIIQGYADLLLLDKNRDTPGYPELHVIRQTAERGGDLVKRILTFSRKVDVKPRPLSLNHEVLSAVKLLSRTIPKMISVTTRLAGDLKSINADPVQVEQILMNLAVNAKDAMPETGGTIVIETENVTLDEEYCAGQPEVTPGEYVALRFSDTGHGIEQTVMNRIFEPFFTTKKPGEGTGLGLAMVFGIVKSHGGHITCHSEPGAGTVFNIYFPAIVVEEAGDVSTTLQMPALGTETILLVDDEEYIRDLGKRILSRAGYRVLTAGNGQEAIEIYSQKESEISLVLMDLIMPEMGGKECLEKLLQINPETKAIVTSGLLPDQATREFIRRSAKGFIGKPYNLKEISLVIREVLDKGR